MQGDFPVIDVLYYDNVDGQKIAKKVSRQIAKETTSLKKTAK